VRRFESHCGNEAAASTAVTVPGHGVTTWDLHPLAESLPGVLGASYGGMYWTGPQFQRLEILVTDEASARRLLAATPRARCAYIDTIKVPFSQARLLGIARALTNDARTHHLVINNLTPDPKSDQLVVQVPAHAVDAAGPTGTPDPAANEAKVRNDTKPYGSAVRISTGDRVLIRTSCVGRPCG
jgi:hypothetical protein